MRLITTVILTIFVGLTLAAVIQTSEGEFNLISLREKIFGYKRGLAPCESDCSRISQNHLITRKGDINLRVPVDYIEHYYPEHWRPRPNRYQLRLNAKWPNMSPFSTKEIKHLFSKWDKVDREKNHKIMDPLDDLVEIIVSKSPKTPVSITAKKLEAAVVKRFGKPVDIVSIPFLQEYPENPRNNAYRDKDNAEKLADGMPVYIYCGGKPLLDSVNIKKGRCLIQMTWPNGLEVDIEFGRHNLMYWRDVHDKTIDLFHSFVINGSLPNSTLLID